MFRGCSGSGVLAVLDRVIFFFGPNSYGIVSLYWYYVLGREYYFSFITLYWVSIKFNWYWTEFFLVVLISWAASRLLKDLVWIYFSFVVLDFKFTGRIVCW